MSFPLLDEDVQRRLAQISGTDDEEGDDDVTGLAAEGAVGGAI